jgi:hypothetical protein
LLLRDVGKQRQRREPDQELVGRRTDASTEDGRKRIALRRGQLLEVIQHRPAELMEAAVGQLQLRLDAFGPRDAPAVGAVGHVAEQRALADARLAAQHGDAALTYERAGQEPVERLAFGPTAEEAVWARPCLSSHCRPTNVSIWCPTSGKYGRRNCGRRSVSADFGPSTASLSSNLAYQPYGKAGLAADRRPGNWPGTPTGATRRPNREAPSGEQLDPGGSHEHHRSPQ